jgi:hypothetical protein
VLLANEDGREVFLFKNAEGWSTRLTDAVRHPGRQLWRRLTGAGSVVEDWRESTYDPRQRPWFKGAMSLRRESDVHWTEPYRFFAANEPGVTVSMRVDSPVAGGPAVIAFDINLRDLSALSASLMIGAHGGVAILTADGRLIGLPRGAAPRSDAQTGALLLKKPADAGFPEVDAVLARWPAAGHPKPIIVQPPAARDAWLGWIESVGVGDQRIVVAAIAPQSDFAIGGFRHAAAIGAILLVAFGIALFLARHGARRVAATVRALADSSDRIGNLDLDRPVTVATRTREFQDLIRSQEQMRQALLAATRHLEKTVEERTAEIAQAAPGAPGQLHPPSRARDPARGTDADDRPRPAATPHWPGGISRHDNPAPEDSGRGGAVRRARAAGSASSRPRGSSARMASSCTRRLSSAAAWSAWAGRVTTAPSAP